MRTVPARTLAARTITLATLVACSPEAPTAVDGMWSAPALARSAAVERPWKGRCEGLAVLSGLQLQITGTCHIAHLGRTTLVAEQVLIPGPDGFAGPLAFTSTVSYTAANGDVVRTTDRGVATIGPDGVAHFVATETVVGGTGRFAGASGEGTRVGATASTGEGAYSFTGTIRY
jgi:hypothetical protein